MVNLDPVSFLTTLPGWLALILSVFLVWERRRTRQLLETSERVKRGRRRTIRRIRNFVKDVSSIAPSEDDVEVTYLRNEIVNYLFDSKEETVDIRYSPVRLRHGNEELPTATGASRPSLREIKRFLSSETESDSEFTLQYVSSPERLFPVGSVGVNGLCITVREFLVAMDDLREAFEVIEDFDPTLPDELENQGDEYLKVFIDELSRERVLEVEQSMSRAEIRRSLLTNLFGIDKIKASYQALQPYLVRLEKVQSDLARLV